MKGNDVTLGFACSLQNPTLGLALFGSPYEVRESVARAGMTLRDAIDHPESTVDLGEIHQEQPLLRFRGGPHAEELMALLERLDSGNLERLEVFAKVLTSGSDGAYVPLVAACASGAVQHVERLLGLGAGIDLPGDLGMSPLHWAAARGHEAVVVVLLGAGARAAATNWFCLTPGELAALNGHDSLARTLGQAHFPRGRAWLELTYERMRAL